MITILYSVERLTCSRHDIADKLLSNNNHSLTLLKKRWENIIIVHSGKWNRIIFYH